jgi:phosphoenolpyruvate carboxykinase (GTP)
MEAFDWKHGVYLGATMGSETTAAATGQVGLVRRDPMAMLPFCGYHIADYFAHWLAMGPRLKRSPKIFMVNWFKKDAAGSFLWPGYGENLRVLKWIVDRVDGRAGAEDKPVGLVPRTSDINLEGLEMASERLRAAMAIERDDWSAELRSQDEFFYRLDCELPREIEVQHETLAAAFEL